MNLNTMDNQNRTPLFVAVETNNAQFVETLISLKAKKDVVDLYGSSLLHIAVLNENITITSQLLNRGINIEAVNNKGTAPLEIARREGAQELYDLLLDHDADLKKIRTHHLEGEYLGQIKPASEPIMFAPNFVSTENWNINAVFHPNGKEFYFTIESRKYNSGTIMVSKLVDNIWTKPVLMNISGDYKEVDPFITSDGTQLYYSTDRPVNEADSLKEDVDLWVLNRDGNKWGAPIHLESKINTNESEWFPTVSANGTLFFSREESANIYSSKFEHGSFQEGIELGESINSDHYDYDPYIASDESFFNLFFR